MERFVDLSLADVGRTVYRYRPVIAAATAIVVIGLALPGPQQRGSDLAQFASGSTLSQPTTQTPRAVAEVAPEATPDASFGGESSSGLASSNTSFDSGSTPTVGSSDRSTTFHDAPAPSNSAASSTESAESSRSTEPSFTPPPSDSSSSASSSPSSSKASIVTTSYASRTAGTPLAADGVPAKSLPVGTRLGQEDKVSFIRLSKPVDTLVLKTVAAGDRRPETAAIQVCVVKSSGWAAGEAVAFTAAPERDCTVSVLGARAANGSWSFDLRPFAGRGDGFSFSPAPGSPVDFQVAFEATLP